VHWPGLRYALKFCLHGPGEHPVADARAEREVQLLLRAAHENVVRVVTYGRWEHPEKGRHYAVLQWVEGGTLWQWAGVARPNPRQVVRLCQKLSRALQRAHEAGVVHRDVKPDNVLIRAADGEPFLSDFGVGSAQGANTLTAGVPQPGTLPFLSPQLLATHLPGAAPYQAQPADDWYALGVVLYVLLTDVLPYPEDLEANVLAQWVARCKPVAPDQLNPRVPPALGQVALKLLSAEPHLRYADGQAVCAALEQALATAQQPEAPLLPGPAPDAALTLPPTTGDGPLAQDLEVLNAHAFREEEDPDDERLEQTRDLRDRLLKTRGQRRSPRVLRRAAYLARQPWARGVAAAMLLGGLVLGAWGLGRRPSATPADERAPQASPPVAASGASPHLAPSDASPPKEGSPVKTPLSAEPPSSSSPAEPPKPAQDLTKAALCAMGLAVAGCASVPVHPTRQQCPPEAWAAMQQRNWDTVGLYLDPNSDDSSRGILLRPGPIISAIRLDHASTDEGLAGLLHGHVFHAEDGRVVVRYTEVELPEGGRVPVCFAIHPPDPDAGFDVSRRALTPDGEPYAANSQFAKRVRVLPD
jgi:serine/threonine-protein kinase